MENLPSLTTWAIPFFVITVALEWWWSRKTTRVRYEAKDAFTSLTLGLGSQFIGILTSGLVLALSLWVYEHRIVDIDISVANLLWLAPLAFVLDDFSYYWFHRTAHRVRWFWAAHVIHHSSQHYNLSTALRQTWTGFFALSFIFSLPLFFLGFPPALIFFLSGLNLVYQYWIHTEAIDRMPKWFEYAFASSRPSCDQPALSRPQLCRRVHHLGQDVRHLRTGDRCGKNSIWHHQESREFQLILDGLP